MSIRQIFAIGALIAVIVVWGAGVAGGIVHERHKWEALNDAATIKLQQENIEQLQRQAARDAQSSAQVKSYADELERTISAARADTVAAGVAARVCSANRATDTISRTVLPGDGRPAAVGPTADTDPGKNSAGLGTEIISCVGNTVQLRNLQTWVRANQKAHP